MNSLMRPLLEQLELDLKGYGTVYEADYHEAWGFYAGGHRVRRRATIQVIARPDTEAAKVDQVVRRLEGRQEAIHEMMNGHWVASVKSEEPLPDYSYLEWHVVGISQSTGFIQGSPDRTINIELELFQVDDSTIPPSRTGIQHRPLKSSPTPY